VPGKKPPFWKVDRILPPPPPKGSQVLQSVIKKQSTRENANALRNRLPAPSRGGPQTLSCFFFPLVTSKGLDLHWHRRGEGLCISLTSQAFG